MKTVDGRAKKKVIESHVGKRACTFDPMEKRYTRSIRKQQQMTRDNFP
jgi:hypothetical protein